LRQKRKGFVTLNIERWLSAVLIGCGLLSFACLVAIYIHYGGFSAYVETFMRAAPPHAGQVALADLFGVAPVSVQRWDLISLPIVLVIATVTESLFGFDLLRDNR
jgi:hypothetical protein